MKIESRRKFFILRLTVGVMKNSEKTLRLILCTKTRHRVAVKPHLDPVTSRLLAIFVHPDFLSCLNSWTDTLTGYMYV